MTVRTLLLLAAVSCAAVSMLSATHLDWFGVGYDQSNHAAFLAASVGFFAASALPWFDWKAKIR